jgi:hypothetical protein
MQILRHSQISATTEIYTKATSEATRAALKRLGELSPHTSAPGAEDAATAPDDQESEQ